MSYPPPPGFGSKSGSSTPQPHNLPARPPPSSNGPPPSFKSNYSNGPHNGPTPAASGASNAFTAFAPRSVTSSNFRNAAATPPTYSAPPVTNYSTSAQQSQSQDSYQANLSQYPGQQYASSQPFAIRNPFVPTGSDTSGTYNGYSNHDNYDPEMEAQIAQWQSAYAAKDSDANKTSGIRRDGPASATGANTGPLGPSSRSDHDKKDTPKTVVRSGGGKSWQDTSLLEWDPAHFRLFVGNLAGEVTDDSLLKAFAKYPSVQKARVVRDKRTTKSKGFGFVSFSDGDEYFQAAREMNGKYIGSHPVLLRKSTTEIRPQAQKDDRKGGKHGKGGHGKGNGGPGGKVERGGIEKKPAKTKGGLKILG
ncbi:MAG: hypothetical protein Q9227_002352 [Pyrenula ochraceoflavens]